MKTNVLSMTAVASALLLNATTVSIWATGFRLPDQDGFATARGEAFVATADNASAIYYNPAGLTQLQGGNFRAGLYGIYLDPSYQRPTSSGDNTVFANQAKLHAAPQMFYAYNGDNSPVAFGAGLFAPYGLGLRWPQETGFRTLGIQSALLYTTFNPVVAVKIMPTLSVAGGVTANYAQLDLEQGLFWPYSGHDDFRFRGDGWDVGYNFGALWQPHEKLSFGASFRSSTTIGFSGHTEYYNRVALGEIPAFTPQRSGASAEFNFPLIAIVGVSYRPTPKWNFEFNADYADWSTVQTATIKQDSSAILPQNIPVVLDWQSSWYYEFGATRYFDNGYHVSAGYIYNENSVPDAHYTPLVADVDRHFVSVGLGHRGKRWDWDLAYQFGYGAHTVTDSAASATGQTTDGRWQYLSHAFEATIGLRF
jgi:long-chain fatty acid transport protein